MHDRQSRPAEDGRWPWWVGPASIVYWTVFGAPVLVAAPLVTLIHALGSRDIVAGLTLHAAVDGAVFAMAGASVFRTLAPLYTTAWRTLPRSWWRSGVVGGMVAALTGNVAFRIVALLHAQTGDALSFPLFASGLCLAFGGLAVFAVGSVVLMDALRQL